MRQRNLIIQDVGSLSSDFREWHLVIGDVGEAFFKSRFRERHLIISGVCAGFHSSGGGHIREESGG